MIRVLRLIEYIYEDFQQAADDMSHWQLPAFGTRYIAKGRTISSAVLPFTSLEVIETLERFNEERANAEEA